MRVQQIEKDEILSNKKILEELAERVGDSPGNVEQAIKRICKEKGLEYPLKRWAQKSNPRLR